MATVLLARGTYTTQEAVGVAPVPAGNPRTIRFIIERHDGSQGATWPAVGALVLFDWSRQASGNTWAPLFSTLIGNDVGVAGDPRGIVQGAAYHCEAVYGGLSTQARRLRCRFRAGSTLATGVGFEVVA